MANSDNLSDISDPNDQVTEQEKLQALSAQAEFEKGNYSGSLHHLEKLEQSRPQDPKVLHNKAVVTCHQRKLVGIQAFRKTLAAVAQQLQCNIEDPQTLHDVDQCYVFFNEAVTLFHLRQYNATFTILLQIFTLVEQLDENLAKQVCFLLAEVLLHLEFPQHCLNLLQYMETSLLSRGSKLKSSLEKEKEGDKEKDSDKETDRKMGTDESPVSLSIRHKLQQMKIRALLSLRNPQSKKQAFEILSTMEQEDPATICLASHLEYLGGNQTNVTRHLSKLAQKDSNFEETGESKTAVQFNNMGCSFHVAGKPTLACLNFQKALAANDEAFEAFPKPVSGDPLSNRPLHTISTNYKYEILYNMGVALLHSGRGAEAFDCLIETVQLYHTDPLLWLRLAECAIQAHKPDNKKDFNLSSLQQSFVKEVIGSGIHRKLVLNPKISTDDAESSDNAAIPVPTLEFAALCLRNAEYLLNDLDEETEKPVDIKGKPELNLNLPKNQKLMKKFSSNKDGLPTAIAAASAYVSLCLGDHLSALHYAEQLLMQPTISSAQKLVGHLYAAESLVLLNRVGEALPHLQPDNISQLELFPEGQGQDRVGPTPKWFPGSAQTAKVILQYNLSAAYAVRGEYEKSSELLRQLWTAKSLGCEIPLQVVTLALYVELRLGRLDAARAIVKQHCPQYR